MLNFETRGKDRPATLNGSSRSKVPPPVVVLSPTQQLERWLDRAKSEVFTVNATLTPDMAQALLARNPENRTLRMSGATRSVKAYAEAMSRGEWKLNGETIIISKEGLLNDGQHRCNAVVMSGNAIPVLMTFGVERESRETVDQGAARTPGDILSQAGEKNVNQLAHALQFVWSYDDHRVFGYRPTPQQLRETLEAHPELRQAVNDVRALAMQFKLSIGYLAGAYYVCSRVDPIAAERLLQQSESGLNVSESGAPVAKLRKRFMDHLAKRDAIVALEQAALFIKAFNHTLAGRNVRVIVWRRNGDAAESFPTAGG